MSTSTEPVLYTPEGDYTGPWREHAERLAMKLADAGPEEDDARAWLAYVVNGAVTEATRPSTPKGVAQYPVDELAQAADRAREARSELADAVIRGRDVYGFTFRVIAQAVGMTEHGVRALYRREKDGLGGGEDS